MTERMSGPGARGRAVMAAPEGFVSLVLPTLMVVPFFGDVASQVLPSPPRAFLPFIEPKMLVAAMVVVILAALLLPDLPRRRRLLLIALPGLALIRAMSGLLLAFTVVNITSGRGGRAMATPRAGRRVFAGVAGGSLAFVAAWLGYAAATSNSSAQRHLQTLLDGPRLLIENWSGMGLGKVGSRATIAFPGALQVESGVLIVGIELGILGLVAFVAVWAVLGTRLGHALRLDTAAWHSRYGAAVLTAAIPTIVLLAMVQSTSVVRTWWLVLGLSYVLAAPPGRPMPRAGT